MTLLVYHFHVHLKECNLLLTQGKAHEAQFPSVTCQVLGISKSQIETKSILNVNGVLTSLQRCKLGVKNIDKLIMVLMKDWPDDVQMESNEKGGSFDDLLNEKATMIKDNVVMLRSSRHIDDVE